MLKLQDSLDVVEAKLVGVLCRCNNPNPVAKGILLQEFFGQILEIPFGQRNIGCDGELGVAWKDHKSEVSITEYKALTIAGYFDAIA